MSAPVSVDDFLIVLARSKLVEGNRLDGFLRRTNPVPVEPEQLAAQMTRAGLLTPFQVRHLLKGRWLRFFIGPYKVLDRIGAGTMGAVYLCEHQRLRRRVAVKVLLNTKAHDPAMVMRFEREARAVAALDHPNIVHAFDVGCLDGMHYLVMEYIDGVSLLHLLKKEGPLAPRKVADFLRQASSGMQHAHEAGLVHRDLKPANLMIDQNGVIKILDLGLALMAEDEMDLTRGAVLGSAAYMAPEQAMDSHHVDARADIYALGATFYQCLTGRSPQTESMLSIPPPPHSGGDSRLFGRLLDLLRRMMSTGPADRPQTAAAVAVELASWPLPTADPQPTTARTKAADQKISSAATEPDLQRARVTRVVKELATESNDKPIGKGAHRSSAPVAVSAKGQDTPILGSRMPNLAQAVKRTAPKTPSLLSSGEKTVLVVERSAPAVERAAPGLPKSAPACVAPRKASATQRPARKIPETLPAEPSTRHWLWLLAGAGLTGMVVLAGHLLRIW